MRLADVRTADVRAADAPAASGEIVFRPGSLSYLRCALAARSMAPLGRLAGAGAGAGFGVMTYHRVAPRVAGRPAPNLNVTPRRMRQQLAGLLARGYEPWTLRRAVQTHEAGGAVPGNALIVVFDDGYAGVLRHGLPVLAELGVPATVFLPTDHLDTDSPRPFDPWAAACGAGQEDAWRILTSDECRQLQQSGLVELGSHTHRHEDLRGRPVDLQRDIARSVEVLRERFGVARPLFSFPFGHQGPSERDAARRAGVVCGLTTDCQLVRPGDDPFAWGRFGAEQFDTAASLAAKLNGTYSRVQNVWRRLKRSFAPSA